MILIIFQLIVLIFSVMVHEIAHGAVAYWLGDDTAYRAGRLTLNPVKHIDLFGSIILPGLLAVPMLFGARPLIIGWAKPVPYDPRHLKRPVRAAALIALAGPASNILLAIAFAVLARFALEGSALEAAFQMIILINLMLAVFNLVPIPPLDGSKIFLAALPRSAPKTMDFIERNSLIMLLLFIVFGLPLVQAVVEIVYRLLV